MSTIALTNNHIASMVETYVARMRLHNVMFTVEEKQEMCQLLADENDRAYGETYPSPENSYTRSAKFKGSVLTPVQQLKAIQCYSYQIAGVTPPYSVTGLIERMQNTAISTLTGYNDAQWCID